MFLYKTVAGPVELSIKRRDSYNTAVQSYADIINSEAAHGWELDMIQSIPVTKSNGCIAALFGNPTTTITFNMLVFRKKN